MNVSDLTVTKRAGYSFATPDQIMNITPSILEAQHMSNPPFKIGKKLCNGGQLVGLVPQPHISLQNAGTWGVISGGQMDMIAYGINNMNPSGGPNANYNNRQLATISNLVGHLPIPEISDVQFVCSSSLVTTSSVPGDTLGFMKFVHLKDNATCSNGQSLGTCTIKYKLGGVQQSDIVISLVSDDAYVYNTSWWGDVTYKTGIGYPSIQEAAYSTGSSWTSIGSSISILGLNLKQSLKFRARFTSINQTGYVYIGMSTGYSVIQKLLGILYLSPNTSQLFEAEYTPKFTAPTNIPWSNLIFQIGNSSYNVPEPLQ